MTDVFVSIIIPVYNAEDYILECLESVGRQTYGGRMECIIVDDRGQDDSVGVAERFVSAYEGNVEFRIIHNDKNGGHSYSRNAGIKNCKGDYVYFLDSDDYITDDCIERLVETLCQYPDSEMVQAGAVLTTGEESNLYSMEKPFPDYSNNREWIQRTMYKHGGDTGIPLTAWNRLVKKSFITENQLYFKEGVILEDNIWSAMLADTLNSIAFCKKDTYIYRIRPQSTMTSMQASDDYAEAGIVIWNEMLRTCGRGNTKLLQKLLWERVHYVYTKDIKFATRLKLSAFLWKVAARVTFPTSLLILLYTNPVVFYLRFLRKLVIKGSVINTKNIPPVV